MVSWSTTLHPVCIHEPQNLEEHFSNNPRVSRTLQSEKQTSSPSCPHSSLHPITKQDGRTYIMLWDWITTVSGGDSKDSSTTQPETDFHDTRSSSTSSALYTSALWVKKTQILSQVLALHSSMWDSIMPHSWNVERFHWSFQGKIDLTWYEVGVKSTGSALRGVARALAAHRKQNNALTNTELDTRWVTLGPLGPLWPAVCSGQREIHTQTLQLNEQERNFSSS